MASSACSDRLRRRRLAPDESCRPACSSWRSLYLVGRLAAGGDPAGGRRHRPGSSARRTRSRPPRWSGAAVYLLTIGAWTGAFLYARAGAAAGAPAAARRPAGALRRDLAAGPGGVRAGDRRRGPADRRGVAGGGPPGADAGRARAGDPAHDRAVDRPRGRHASGSCSDDMVARPGRRPRGVPGLPGGRDRPRDRPGRGRRPGAARRSLGAATGRRAAGRAGRGRRARLPHAQERVAGRLRRACPGPAGASSSSSR